MARYATAVATSTSGTPSIETLTALHPLYRQNLPHWQKILDFAEGNDLGRYIIQHQRESDDAYNRRKKRIGYRNFVDPILSTNTSYLFSKSISREATSTARQSRVREQPSVPFSGGRVIRFDERRRQMKPPDKDLVQRWKDFCYDVDGQGNTIDRYMKRATYWTLGFGMTHHLVDLPRIEQAPRSRAEQTAMNLRPYYAMYLPMDLVNWEVDQYQRFKWVRFREPITDDIQPFDPKGAQDRRLFEDILRVPTRTGFALDGQPQYTGRGVRALYRTFDRERWYLHEVKDGQVTERGGGDHKLGVVPVVTAYNRQRARHPVIGRSEVGDIVGLNQEILNTDSLIVEAEFQQCINILCMKKQANPKKEFVIGPENILFFTGEFMPQFLTPSTAPLQFMEARVQGLIGDIYRQAKFQGGNALEVRAVPSGTAQTVEFNETDRALAEKAEELQNFEWQLHYLWFLYQGALFDGTVDYPDTFQVQSFLEELQQVTQAKQAIRSDRFARELEKRCTRRMLPNVPQDTMDAIEDEIDIIPPSISSFSGPVWYDPITQEIRQPTDTSAAPIGVLGELYGRLMQEADATGAPPTPDAAGLADASQQQETDAALQQQQQMEQQQAQQVAKVQRTNPKVRVLNHAKRAAKKSGARKAA